MDTNTENTTTDSRRGRVLTAVGLAGAIVAAVLAFGVSSSAEVSGVPAGAQHQQAIADFANANGLTGGSPAGLRPPSPRERAYDVAIADWAQANGLSGLSPAGLAPVAQTDTSAYSAHAAIAEWARENGMSGLSPASVSPVE